MREFDLVALGEVAIDVILAGVDRVPSRWSILGRTKAAGIFTAGTAGYVAQCYSKLGGRVAVAGRIGDDKIGRIVVDGFKQCGVSTRYLVVDKKTPTEVSTVVLYNDGNKASVVSEILPLGLGQLNIDCVTQTRAFHIAGYLLYPDIWQGRDIIRWLRLAKREGTLISLDPQMSATGRWRDPILRIISQLDVLLLDEVEAQKISGRKRTVDAIESLLKHGVRIVAVKAGKKGCIVGEDGRLISVRSLKTKTVSTIGAGDAFDAAFIHGCLQNWNLEKTARFANVVAALSTTRLGCMMAIPGARDAEKMTEKCHG